jgi:hypothetical protein
VLLEDLCFDAQQAAEKAIKAVFIRRGERFPFVHDLDDLLNCWSETVSRYRNTFVRPIPFRLRRDNPLSRHDRPGWPKRIPTRGSDRGERAALGRAAG